MHRRCQGTLKNLRLHVESGFQPTSPADDVNGRAYQMLAESYQFHGRCKGFSIVHSNGVLIVTGCVPSFYLKQVLQEILKRVDGVRRVDNRVDVIALDGLSSVPSKNDSSKRWRHSM
jgi:osmotically-inducible protein OsmY